VAEQGELIPSTGIPLTTEKVSTQGNDLISRARELDALGDPDVETFYEAVELDTIAKKLRAAAVKFCADVKATTHAAWKAAVAQEKTLLKPIDDSRDIFDKIMRRRHELDQIEASQEAAATATEGASSLQAAREAEVASLRAAGQEDAARDLEAQPLPTSSSPAANNETSADGISWRGKWTAQIKDPQAALEAICANEAWRTMFLTLDQSALDAAMQRTKGSLKIKGIVAHYDESTVNRR
jgi:hypothetical protein